LNRFSPRPSAARRQWRGPCGCRSQGAEKVGSGRRAGRPGRAARTTPSKVPAPLRREDRVGGRGRAKGAWAVGCILVPPRHFRIPHTAARDGPRLATTNSACATSGTGAGWRQTAAEDAGRHADCRKSSPGRQVAAGEHYNGHADSQSEAMWAYVRSARVLPLHEGLEAPTGPEGRTRPGGEGPAGSCWRTLMPEAGGGFAVAIAVGTPRVSTAFERGDVPEAYAGAENFLDTFSQVWATAGGAPAKLLGAKSSDRAGRHRGDGDQAARFRGTRRRPRLRRARCPTRRFARAGLRPIRRATDS